MKYLYKLDIFLHRHLERMGQRRRARVYFMDKYKDAIADGSTTFRVSRQDLPGTNGDTILAECQRMADTLGVKVQMKGYEFIYFVTGN